MATTVGVTAYPREGTSEAGAVDLQPGLLPRVRFEVLREHPALPTPGISVHTRYVCFPSPFLLPYIASHHRGQFPIGQGAMQSLLEQLGKSQPLPLHPTLVSLVYTSHQQPTSLPHPPARLPYVTISALTCTSDTPILRLISPRAVSSAAIASAWHLQAPGSLSPKDFLKARTLNF